MIDEFNISHIEEYHDYQANDTLMSIPATGTFYDIVKNTFSIAGDTIHSIANVAAAPARIARNTMKDALSGLMPNALEQIANTVSSQEGQDLISKIANIDFNAIKNALTMLGFSLSQLTTIAEVCKLAIEGIGEFLSLFNQLGFIKEAAMGISALFSSAIAIQHFIYSGKAIAFRELLESLKIKRVENSLQYGLNIINRVYEQIYNKINPEFTILEFLP